MYQIKSSCSGCHACELNCPVGACYYDGPQYQIDPDKCIGCGTCYEICPTCSVYDTEAKPAAAAHDPIVKQCDVVVCGGGAGLITAVRAAQSGKRVILLEKARKVGGDMNLAHGFFPVYSKVHAEEGLEDIREDAVRDLAAKTDGVISEELMRTAVYATSAFADWLMDFPGAREAFPLEKFGEKRAMGPIYGSAIFGFPKRIENPDSTDPSIGPGWMGTFIKNAMLREIEDEKLPVEILTETPAEHLLTGPDGAVVGVLARDPGGVVEIHAGAVVLLTGGYGASDEKLTRFFPDFFEGGRPVTRFTIPSNTGDAIDMLEELGVHPDTERMFVSNFGPAHHPYSYALYRLLDHPTALDVTMNGTRFFDESTGLHGSYPKIKCGPKQIMWGIFTQKNIDDVMAEFLSDPTLADEYNCYENYQNDLDREAAYKLPPVMKAATLEELAGKLGIPAEALVGTIADYNRFCEQGADTDQGKAAAFLRPRRAEDGPWYAIYGQMFSECSAGGVQVNGRCQVLRDDGTPIPGLYAGGNATGAMHRRDKLAVVSELTWAVASAWQCAEEICGR